MCEKCNEMRQGTSWADFLTRYRLLNICDDGEGWTVRSSSGSTYHVHSHTYIDRGSGSMAFRMECDCPARRGCRHIEAVMNMRHAEELASARDGDTDGMEILERTE